MKIQGIKHKRGMIEVQFNYIFIMIVGAIILALFAVVIMKQKDSSDTAVSGKVGTRLDTIFVSAQQSTGTVHAINFTQTTLFFDCNAYYVNSYAVAQDFGNRVVFAPEMLDGDAVITWTLDWKVPYKVTNFLMLSNPKTLIVVLGPDADRITDIDPFTTYEPDAVNEELNEHLRYLLPVDQMNIRFAESILDTDTIDMIARENADTVILVFAGASTADDPDGDIILPNELAGEPISAVWLQHNAYKNGGTDKVIHFYEKIGDELVMETDPVYFINDAMMVGSIFSPRKDIYTCIMQRAGDYLSTVTQVYYARLQSMEDDITGFCSSSYFTPMAHIKDINTTVRNGFDPEDDGQRNELFTKMQLLTAENQNILDYSCPPIY